MMRLERRGLMPGLLPFHIFIAALSCLAMLLMPAAGESAMGEIGHFPMTSGSSWTFATTALTLNNNGQQEMMSAVEDVTVTGGGVFHSAITFSNGNTTTSDNLYFLGDALYIAQTHIVIFTKMTTQIGDFTTTTTTDNSYSPPQEYFPSEPYPGNVETSSGQCHTDETVVSTTPFGPGSSSGSSKTTMENVTISVAGSEPVTVGAGTFPSALKLQVTMMITEGGQTYPYNYTAWYAEGVGLVKFTSPNMNRDLVSYAVNPVEPSLVEIDGRAGSFNSLNDAFGAANNNDILKLRASDYHENPAPALNRPVNLVLRGGLSGDYSTVVGHTYLQGPLTLQAGSMVVSNLAIY